MLSTWWLGFNCFNHPPSWFFWDFMVIFDGFKSLLMVLFPMYDLNYLAITMFQITSQFANWKITMFKFRKKWEFVKSARSRHLKLLPIFQQLWPPGAGQRMSACLHGNKNTMDPLSVGLWLGMVMENRLLWKMAQFLRWFTEKVANWNELPEATPESARLSSCGPY